LWQTTASQALSKNALSPSPQAAPPAPVRYIQAEIWRKLFS